MDIGLQPSLKVENVFNWHGRCDAEDGTKGLRWHQRVQYEKAQNRTLKSESDILKRIFLIGLESDVGVENNKGRLGAANGPNAIRDALANLPWLWPDTALIDMGNCGLVINGDKDSNCPDTRLDYLQTRYANVVCDALMTDKNTTSNFVIGLGGGHEIAWGSYQGLFNAISNSKRIGIINFDAHFDLRKPAPYYSSGTPFRQVFDHCQQHHLPFSYACIGVSKAANTAALFEFANHSKTRYLLDRSCNDQSIKSLLTPMLENIDELYVTVCLDAFPAAFAPGVSAPSALGIAPELAINTLHFLAQQQSMLNYDWRLCDIAEMNPTFDIDSRTAKLAARLIFEVVDAII